MALEVFRIIKNEGYTVMSNHHLNNDKLSFKSVGIMSKLLSLPKTWDFTLKGLAKTVQDGVDSTRTGILELERNGYITRHRLRDEKGVFIGIEYLVYESPFANPEFDPNLNREYSVSNKRQKKTKTDSEKSDFLPRPENWDTVNLELEKSGIFEEKSGIFEETPEKSGKKHPKLENPILDNPKLGEPILENPTQTITKETNTNLNNYYNNPIISYQNKKENKNKDTIRYDGIGDAVSEEEYYAAIEETKANIEYDFLIEEGSLDPEELDEMVAIIAEVLCSKKKTIRISGQEHTVTRIQKRLRSLSSEHILYVNSCMKETATEIKNIKKYLLAALYNAPVTMSSYYAAKVRSDFGKRA